MLTQRQQYLFEQLGIGPEREKELRFAHKYLVEQGLAVKDFTRHLTKMVHRHWQQQNRKIYVGD